jgi:hypothetical protein
VALSCEDMRSEPLTVVLEEGTVPYLIGIFLALGVSVLARGVGFDRDRAFYPVVMIVIASYYGLFAIMGESMRALGIEASIMLGFIVLSIVGFRSSLWLVAAALAGHGFLDFFHGRLVANPGVPTWWPPFCLAYDVTAAAYLAWLLRRSRLPARPQIRTALAAR